MRSFILYSFLLTLLSSCSDNKVKESIMQGEDIGRSYMNLDTNRVKLDTTYYRNGNVKFYGPKIDSIKHGYCKEFYENKQIKSEGVFRFNCKEGFWTYFDIYGSKISEIHYENNIQSGLTKIYINDSIVIEEGVFLGGKRNGWFQFFNNEGILIEECSYLNGVKNGGYKFYLDNYLFTKGSYNMGEKVGVWTTYNSKGKIISEINED